MREGKEKKPIVITGAKVANAVGALALVIGIIFVVTNLIGVTDLDWLSVGLMFVAPCMTVISNMGK
ncbi:MAG: hypothetical protein FWG93_02030 [Oscillospiraceae bacterium]|nr:hypothetical protein [Oscillospiraceae bacterium]